MAFQRNFYICAPQPRKRKFAAFVYRLGHLPFTEVRGVRLPYAVLEPIIFFMVGFFIYTIKQYDEVSYYHIKYE